MQLQIALEDRELLRHVADLALERPDLRGHVGDLGGEPRLLRLRRGDPRLDLAELAAVVACGRSREYEAGSEDDGQSASHERKVRQGFGRPCPGGRG